MIRFNAFANINATCIHNGKDNMKKCHNFDEKWSPFNVCRYVPECQLVRLRKYQNDIVFFSLRNRRIMTTRIKICISAFLSSNLTGGSTTTRLCHFWYKTFGGHLKVYRIYISSRKLSTCPHRYFQEM